MRKGVAVAIAAVAIAGGYGAGRVVRSRRAVEPVAKGEAGTPAKKPSIPIMVSSEVYKVSVGAAPTRGGKQPKVTIVEFSEFQCPFCARVQPALAAIEKQYGEDVLLAFRHFPLPFHQNARIAALAAEAAREQGKFWEMHDKMFASQDGGLERDKLEKHAAALGLDAAKFKASLDAETGKAAMEADAKEAAQFSVRGTPTFFINGRLFRGAQPLESFKKVIDEEIVKADARLKAGVARESLYSELLKDGQDKLAPPPQPSRPGQPEAGAAYRVDVGSAPAKGARDALVTIVQFSDYQCPFCSRVEPTIDKVMDTYKGKVRLVWKDLPLAFHQNAVPAALAARAAGEQGKFWEMHRRLFENQQNLDAATFAKHARDLGLDMGKFKAALGSEKLKKAVDGDAAQAGKVGVTGTPAFFVNGVFLSGAQPFERFQAVIDEEIKKAEAVIAKGTPRGKVYEAIMKEARTEVAAAPARPPAAEAGPESDTTVHKVDPGDSPSRGPKNAPITMVIFSEFQCPFCKRVKPTFDQIEKEYPGKVRVVWKNFPLDFHQHAKPAAEAAMAAAEQGKFWEMHDKLFENQQSLDRPSLEKYAQDIGLDMGKFKAALDAGKNSARIDADQKQGSSLGVSGTPATFVNGRRIGGAYPFETFKKVIDQELAKKTTRGT